MSRSTGFLAGLLGALVISMFSAGARAVGVDLEFEMLLGSWLTALVGPATWLIGFTMHLVLGGLLGVGYAMLLPRAGTVIDAGAGAGVGVSHALVAGVALVCLPALHPAVP